MNLNTNENLSSVWNYLVQRRRNWESLTYLVFLGWFSPYAECISGKRHLILVVGSVGKELLKNGCSSPSTHALSALKVHRCTVIYFNLLFSWRACVFIPKVLSKKFWIFNESYNAFPCANYNVSLEHGELSTSYFLLWTPRPVILFNKVHLIGWFIRTDI
jgi:hypothetical protein